MTMRKEAEGGKKANKKLEAERKDLKSAGPKAREAAAGRKVNHMLDKRRK